MDDTGKPLASRSERLGGRASLIMLHENRRLREAVAELRQRISDDERAGLERADQLCMLREANEHLVLATLSATDLHAAAQTANARQTEFLALLAHELRDPIASISFANTVMRGMEPDSTKLDKLIDIVARHSSHMVRLVDDLLDVARIHTGKLTLRYCDGMLADVLDVAIATAQPSITQRAQSVELALPAASIGLHADQVRLAQLFGNLLINASKFSPSQSTLHVSAVLQGPQVAVTVRDEGKGIASVDAARMFDLFEQGPDETGPMLSGGLGIGLSLVRSIATLHGGTVGVASAGVGQGCAFTVVLPLTPSASCQAPADNVGAGEALKML